MSVSDKSDTEYKVELELEESSEELEYLCSKRKKPQRRRSKKRLVLEWEEDDEITVLKQLYQFSAESDRCKGLYSKPFYDYVKPKLRNKEVTMTKMSSKIDGFKNQYLEWERKLLGNNINELKFFSGPHQHQVFVLSKRIWGNEDVNYGGMKYLKGFKEFLAKKEIDAKCLMPSCLEYLKKDWAVQLLMYNELLSKKSKFDAKLRELVMYTKSHLSS